ncbi:hypothetical protein, partial [Saccharothrix hoggarensis]
APGGAPAAGATGPRPAPPVRRQPTASEQTVKVQLPPTASERTVKIAAVNLPDGSAGPSGSAVPDRPVAKPGGPTWPTREDAP